MINELLQGDQMVSTLVDTADQLFPEGLAPLQTTTSLKGLLELPLVELTVSIEVKLLKGPGKVVSGQ